MLPGKEDLTNLASARLLLHQRVPLILGTRVMMALIHVSLQVVRRDVDLACVQRLNRGEQVIAFASVYNLAYKGKPKELQANFVTLRILFLGILNLWFPYIFPSF